MADYPDPSGSYAVASPGLVGSVMRPTGPVNTYMMDGYSVQLPADFSPQEVQMALGMVEKEHAFRQQAQTDRTWRPVAVGAGQMAGAILGAGAGAAATPATMGGAAIAAPTATLAGGSLGAAAGGQLYDLGMDAYRRLSGQPTRPLDNQPTRAAWDALSNGTFQAGMDGVVAPAVKAGANKMFGMLTPSGRLTQAVGGALGSEPQKIYDDLMAAGMIPTADLVVNNPTVKGLGAAMRVAPIASNVMAQADATNLAAAQDYAKRVTGMIGTPGTPYAVGQGLQTAAADVRAGMKDTFGKLYGGVYDMVPPESTVDLSPVGNYLSQFQGQGNLQQLATKQVNPYVSAFEKDFGQRVTPPGLIVGQNGQPLLPSGISQTAPEMPFQDALALRTSIRNTIPKQGPYTSEDLLKMNLVKSLDESINTHAANVSPEAAEALPEINAMYRAFKGDKNTGSVGNEGILNSLIQKDNPEEAFKAAANMGSTELSQLLGMLPEKDASALKATLFQRMGMPTGASTNTGEFDFNPFVKNFKNMMQNSPERAALLFSDAPDDAARLARISGAVKTLQGYANPSGTARTMENLKATDIGRAVMEGAGKSWPEMSAVVGGLATGHPDVALASGLIGAGRAANNALTPAFRYYLAKKMVDPSTTQSILSGAATSGVQNALAQSSALPFIPLSAPISNAMAIGLGIIP